MSHRVSYRDLLARTTSEVYQLPSRHSESHDQAPQDKKAQRTLARARRRVFLSRAALVTVVAVTGEIAALAVASALNMGVTATGFTLAGVVLSAVWPLTRCVQ